MKYFIFILFVFTGLLITFSSCDDTLKQEDQDQNIPSSNVSYSQHIQPVFDYHCNNSGCHNEADRAGGLSLTSYANTTADINIVFKGKPENSRLYQDIQPGSPNFMPPITSPYPALNKNQIDGIGTWIREGAKPN